MKTKNRAIVVLAIWSFINSAAVIGIVTVFISSTNNDGNGTMPKYVHRNAKNTRVYYVEDLLPNDRTFDPLVTSIVKTVSPKSWEEVGGPGSVAAFPTNGSLVIQNSDKVHQEVAELLAMKRTASLR